MSFSGQPVSIDVKRFCSSTAAFILTVTPLMDPSHFSCVAVIWSVMNSSLRPPVRSGGRCSCVGVYVRSGENERAHKAEIRFEYNLWSVQQHKNTILVLDQVSLVQKCKNAANTER